jgi:hypothetical protein
MRKTKSGEIQNKSMTKSAKELQFSHEKHHLGGENCHRIKGCGNRRSRA